MARTDFRAAPAIVSTYTEPCLPFCPVKMARTMMLLAVAAALVVSASASCTTDAECPGCVCVCCMCSNLCLTCNCPCCARGADPVATVACRTCSSYCVKYVLVVLSSAAEPCRAARLVAHPHCLCLPLLATATTAHHHTSATRAVRWLPLGQRSLSRVWGCTSPDNGFACHYS